MSIEKSDIDTTEISDKKMMTSNEALKELNNKLGITDRDSMLSVYEAKSVEEMLENSRKEFELFSKSIAEKKENVDNATEDLENAVKVNSNPLTTTADSKKYAVQAMTTFKDSLDALTSLIHTGEDIMIELVNAIKSTDIIDPDVVSSTAHIIEGIRISIADIINYNTEKMKLEQQYRLAMDSETLKQKHRLELEYFKSELRLKEARIKSDIKKAEENSNAITVESNPTESNDGVSTWSQIDIVNAIRQTDEEVKESIEDKDKKDDDLLKKYTTPYPPPKM